MVIRSNIIQSIVHFTVFACSSPPSHRFVCILIELQCKALFKTPPKKTPLNEIIEFLPCCFFDIPLSSLVYITLLYINMLDYHLLFFISLLFVCPFFSFFFFFEKQKPHITRSNGDFHSFFFLYRCDTVDD